MPPETRTPRQRYRAQVQEEIKRTALAQIAAGGIEGLSVNAVAKAVGMSGPALYKYFRSRDELLTALIHDGYEDAAATLATAARKAAKRSPRAQLLALGAAFRGWALAQPHRYLLLAGTPSATYRAPDTTTRSARAALGPLMSVLARGTAVTPPRAEPLREQMEGWSASTPEVAEWVAAHAPGADPGPTLAAVLIAWTRMHGVVSLEVAGHFTGMGHDPGVLLAHELAALADAFGLPDAG